MKVSKKKLRVYRSLYWANQGLIHAINALGELYQEPALPHEELRETQAMIEEARTQVNDRLAEWIVGHQK
jgi:hypothetical protein